MKFKFEHIFDADMETVVGCFLDPELPAYLMENMSTVQAIEPLSIEEEGGLVRRKVRYQPVPLIKRVGPKKVDPKWMCWVEESIYDRARRRMEFSNVPITDFVAKRMSNSGTVTLTEAGAGKTLRIIEGELRIKFPLLGRIAERIIYKDAAKIINEEAEVFSGFVKSRA